MRSFLHNLKNSPFAIATKRYWYRTQRIARFLFYTILESTVLPRSQNSSMKTLLLTRLDSIGDYILFRNYIEALKRSQRFSSYKIVFCGNSRVREIAETFDGHVVDDFLWIDPVKFEKSTSYRLKILSTISRFGVEVVINPVYNRNVLLEDSIVRASNAQRSYGCTGSTWPSKPWELLFTNTYYTDLIEIPGSIFFEFLRTKYFIEHILQEPVCIQKPSLTLSSQSQGVKEPYCVLCPGGQFPMRKWALRNYLHLALFIYERFSLKSILIGDAGDLPSEADQHLLSKMNYCITNLIAKTSLLETLEIIAQALFVVTNDTSISHIAVSLNKPTIVVSNANHYGRFTEYPAEIYNAIEYIYPPQFYADTFNFKQRVNLYAHGSPLDINTISLETVQQKVQELITQLKLL